MCIQNIIGLILLSLIPISAFIIIWKAEGFKYAASVFLFVVAFYLFIYLIVYLLKYQC